MAIILIDFDNTITSSNDGYPMIPPIRPYAKEVINKYYDIGHCIIINTCRCDEQEVAVKEWLTLQGVKFCHVNDNCEIRKKQFGNNTRKIGGHINIDDKNIDSLIHGIDWKLIDIKLNYILKTTNYGHTRCF